MLSELETVVMRELERRARAEERATFRALSVALGLDRRALYVTLRSLRSMGKVSWAERKSVVHLRESAA